MLFLFVNLPNEIVLNGNIDVEFLACQSKGIPHPGDRFLDLNPKGWSFLVVDISNSKEPFVAQKIPILTVSQNFK